MTGSLEGGMAEGRLNAPDIEIQSQQGLMIPPAKAVSTAWSTFFGKIESRTAGSTTADGGQEMNFTIRPDGLHQAERGNQPIDDHGHARPKPIASAQPGLDPRMEPVELVNELPHGIAAGPHGFNTAGEVAHKRWNPDDGHGD
jgi:hypothetical protein